MTGSDGGAIGELTDAQQRGALRKVTLRLIPFLFFLYVIAYLDRVNLSFAKLDMQGMKWLTDGVYGFGSGIFFIGYFFFEVPSNLILARVGARRWIARIMFTWGITAMAMASIHSVASFYTMRFLLGLAEAGFFPGVLLYMTFWFTRKERAQMVALFMLANAVAFVFGGPASTQILNLRGLQGLAGWQWLFLLEGLPAVLLGFVVLAYLPDGPTSAKWLRLDEREWIEARLHSEDRAQPHRHETLRAAMLQREVWLLALLYGMLVLGMYGFGFWIPQIVKDFHLLSDSQASLVVAIPYLVSAVTMVLIGRHSDRTGERRRHLAVSAVVAAVGLAVASAILMYSGRLTPHLCMVLSMEALTVGAIGMWGTLGPFWALPPALLKRTAAAGGIALVNSVGNLGGFAGPFLFGFLKGRGYGTSGGLLALAAALLVGSVVALCIQEPRVDEEMASPGRQSGVGAAG